jgi:HSP20 family protein
MKETQDIDTAIDQVERLFRSVTGHDAPPVGEKPYATIPPEKNPEDHIQEQIDLLVEKFAEVSGNPAVGGMWKPPISLWEGKKEVLITVDLPGVAREAVQVRAGQGLLEISGSRRIRPDQDGERFDLKYVENPSGKFRRTIALPLGAVTDGLHAQLRNGVLELRIPRDPGMTDAKTIHVA